ncbi:MAG TPA: hypothetical protein VKH34_05375 [Vicinamibacterales bacterium]|nr:hypothetical protein [Vicinamibacterales bacterium]
MSGRAALVATALLLSSAATPALQKTGQTDFLSGNDALALTIEAPIQELFEKGSEDEKFSVPGRVTYKDPSSGGDVTRDAVVSVRGHTSRRETECAFPKLKLKFKEGDVLRIGTHCGEAADETLSAKYGRMANERSPQRELLAYRLLQAADVPTLRTRPASITYVDKGQPALTRRALLIEDDDDAMKRVKGTAEIAMEQFGSVTARSASADAIRIAFGQAMIGNFDWCLKFSPDDVYRCDVRKPLWNVLAFDRGGSAALLAKDFDLAGVVVGRHSWFKTIFNPAFVPTKSEIQIEVLSQVQRTRALFSRAELDAARRGFVERKPAIYAALEKTDVDAKGRTIAKDYLDSFFAAIADDQAFYLPVVVAPDIRVYTDAARTSEACKPGDVVRPGTPVNEVQRSGNMAQVIILDAQWRWTSDERCQTVQTSPVWVQSDAISREFPKN